MASNGDLEAVRHADAAVADAKLAALHAADLEAQAAARAKPRPTADERMRAYARENLDRMSAWCAWHIERAEIRGLDGGKGIAALESLFDAIVALRRRVTAGDGGVLTSAGFWVLDAVVNGLSPNQAGDDVRPFIEAAAAVAAGLEAAQEAAEHDWHAATWAKAPRANLHLPQCHQAREVETSDMHELWGAFLGIEEDRCFARSGTYSEAEARQIACERLAFAPAAPPEAGHG